MAKAKVTDETTFRKTILRDRLIINWGNWADVILCLAKLPEKLQPIKKSIDADSFTLCLDYTDTEKFLSENTTFVNNGRSKFL